MSHVNAVAACTLFLPWKGEAFWLLVFCFFSAARLHCRFLWMPEVNCRMKMNKSVTLYLWETLLCDKNTSFFLRKGKTNIQGWAIDSIQNRVFYVQWTENQHVESITATVCVVTISSSESSSKEGRVVVEDCENLLIIWTVLKLQQLQKVR